MEDILCILKVKMYSTAKPTATQSSYWWKWHFVTLEIFSVFTSIILSNDNHTYLITDINVNTSLQVVEDLLKVPCPRCPQVTGIAVRLQVMRENAEDDYSIDKVKGQIQGNWGQIRIKNKQTKQTYFQLSAH